MTGVREITTVCRHCGLPAVARVRRTTGAGCWLHADGPQGHAVDPEPGDEQLRLEFDAPPTLEDVKVKGEVL